MKCETVGLVAVLWLTLHTQDSLAQGPANCIDSATNEKQTQECGEQTIYPVEAKIDADFKRLASKYSGNQEMQEILRNTRENWNGYRNIQCLMEGMVANGGSGDRENLPLASNKAFLKCVLRTAGEMQSALSKL